MDLNLVDTRDMSSKKTEKTTKKAYIIKNRLYTEEELRRYAIGVIEDRIKFCRDVKKEQNADKCACEAIKRWIRLFRDYPMEGSKELGNLRVAMVERVFEEMKKEGKIKCSEE